AIDLSAGRVDFFFVSYSSLLPFLQGGKVRAIAVTSPQRLPVLPDAPTMTEAGFAGLALDAWFGLVAPAGTPDAVIDKLNAAFVQAVRDPQVIKQMTDQGAEGLATTPAQFATCIASETQRLQHAWRAVGVKPECGAAFGGRCAASGTKLTPSLAPRHTPPTFAPQNVAGTKELSTARTTKRPSPIPRL